MQKPQGEKKVPKKEKLPAEETIPDKTRYEDCGNQGHMIATWKREHICLRCQVSQVCTLAVAASQIGGCFPAVSRCLLFTTESDA